MKITTWNVNGLRAALGKGMLDWVRAYEADVLCLQEVRAQPEQLEESRRSSLADIFPHAAWNPASRPGYSGVATLARLQPAESWLGLDDGRFDGEGRVIVSRFPAFLLFNIYFPNGGQDNGRVPYKLDFYARLLDLCDDLHTRAEAIVICGDFNTSHRPIDLKNPKQNEGNTGFMPEEREWIDRYLEHGFVDIFRYLYPERVQYTWWTFRMNARARNVGWRLDYCFIHKSCVERVRDAGIATDATGSDHCPIWLEIAD
jgi:exodeoxyribonuclease-3